MRRTLEHIQHTFRDHEATCNVHTSQKNGRGTQCLRDRSRQVAASHNKQTTNADHTCQKDSANMKEPDQLGPGLTRDCIGDRHERRVQRRCNTPNDTVANKTGKTEREEVAHERRSGQLAESDH